MLGLISKIFDSNEKQISQLRPIVNEINSLEKEFEGLSVEQIKAKAGELREQLTVSIQRTENRDENLNAIRSTLDALLPQAFALVREAAKRTLKMRHFDVQLLAGIVLHQGRIAEQKTGEGKTLTATLPLYLNSLTGFGCHLVTPNDYLSRHGAGWMGPVYHLLGISVGVLVHEQAFIFDPTFVNESFLDEYSKHLRPIDRRQAYACDITYGTNNEFGFDYLRDNMVYNHSEIVQVNSQGQIGSHHFAIVDEVDSILIDEARTPLIISAPAEESTEKYQQFSALVERLTPKTDYALDEKHKTAHLTELGIAKVEAWLGVPNLYEKDFQTVHHLEQALKAKTLFSRDRDYVVKESEVIIVDEFTGRLMFGRRYSDGLHQAIEAKENVPIQRESKTLATISFQNYFRLYSKLAGMTGTALTEAEEFYKIYKLEVLAIPTHQPMIRKDTPDVVYKTAAAKYRAIVADIEDCYQRGQPVLVGTTSIEKNELLHEYLERKGIPHQVLNAKQHEREALIIAQSGRKKTVTIATNMAGRGVDIILGGDPASSRDEEIENQPLESTQGKNLKIKKETEWHKEHDEVVSFGGLRVIGTERHESRRIDNQLRGRSGRQGDPGSSRFYISLQDDLMRIFGGEAMEKLMDRLGIDESMPIENSLISRSIEQAQKRVEGYNFDLRKHLVEYDDVMNKQREVVYTLRRRLLEDSEKDKEWFLDKLTEVSRHQPSVMNDQFVVESDQPSSSPAADKFSVKEVYAEAEKRFGQSWRGFVRQMSLQVIDTLWIEHLDNLDDLREGIGLRGYGGIDPLVEYKREAHALFTRLINEIYTAVDERILQATIETPPVGENLVTAQPRQRIVYRHDKPGQPSALESQTQPATVRREGPKLGRNDPCWCGSGKKYKKCHGAGL